ncbi:hypothetical protein V6N13_032689 [Hibiscus sabdariffa]|uniref:Phospholipase A1 n=1 Tax=Hibiscus sabdariffa TaxID=183260 RepID=A0ABR2FCS9_9ROSI
MASSIASRWRELSGEKNWEGLLNNPIEPDLRRCVIHYGERTMATRDLLNKDTQSTSYLHSLHPEDVFFTGTALQNNNIFKYVVTQFFDAASNASESAWFGYVAVSTNDGKVDLEGETFWLLGEERKRMRSGSIISTSFNCRPSNYLGMITTQKFTTTSFLFTPKPTPKPLPVLGNR